jgi:hypothetical protein
MTTHPTTIDPRAANLLFVAPGIAHLLGNALFTVQGRARLLSMAAADAESPREQIEADAEAVLDGATRSLGALASLRWLLGEHRQPEPLSAALTELVEILRVPVRDHGGRVEISGDTGIEDPVDPCDLAHSILSALRRICEGRHADSFTVELSVRRIDGVLGLTLRSLEDGRSTAHGRPMGLVLEALQAESQGPGAAWRTGSGPDLLVLLLTGTQPNLRTS